MNDHHLIPAGTLRTAIGTPGGIPGRSGLFFINLLSPAEGLVVDPFGGSGTTGIAAVAAGRRCVLIDNNQKYCELATRRVSEESVVAKTNGRYRVVEPDQLQQIKLLESAKSIPLPKPKPVTYLRKKRR